jgi:hypothetical protein
MQVRVNAEAVRKTTESLRHRARLEVTLPVRIRREDKRTPVKLELEHSGSGAAPIPVLSQDRYSFRVDRRPTLLVGLGVLLPRVSAVLGDTATNRDRAAW